jgi:hypothetical protein
MDPYTKIKSSNRQFVRLDPNKSSRKTKGGGVIEEMGLQ